MLLVDGLPIFYISNNLNSLLIVLQLNNLLMDRITRFPLHLYRIYKIRNVIHIQNFVKKRILGDILGVWNGYTLHIT